MPLIPALLLALTACGKPRVQGIATIEEQDAPLKGTIRSADPTDNMQFVSGFYPAESDGWRWSRAHFAVALTAPNDATLNGAILELTYDAPKAVLNQVGPVTVSATIHGAQLEPEKRSQTGIAVYRRTIPASALSQREVLVNFTLDKVVKPNTLPGEDRELGIAVHGVALVKAQQQ